MSTSSGGRLGSLISRIRTPTPKTTPSQNSQTTQSSGNSTSALSHLKPSRRAVSDFYIKLNHPHQRYKPGEQISGSIVLATSRATKITHLTLALSGSVMVYAHDRRGHKWGEDVVKDVAHKDNKIVRGCRSRGTPIEGKSGGRGVMLFEEEQVIVGEGRLGAGGLEVGFLINFPEKGGISSLDFERGAITYLLTATLTRPTSIHPVTTCHHEVKFSENIDVSMFSPPKPLTISIEPQRPLRRLKSSGSSNDSMTHLHQASNTSPPLSPSLALAGSSGVGSLPPSPTVSAVVHPRATIELLRPACLPGESIPIKITVSHHRQFKSISGVITTLSRQCRLDTLPLSDNKNLTTSSLSFSKSSISTFRKDLDQSITPLVVDPRSLTSVVRTSVRIPNDAFPSISKVPQDLLGFTYFIEVVVDLGGKLAGRNGMGDVMMDGSTNEDLRRISPEGIMETDRIRREKGVVSCTFEVVVGTVDTGGKGKKKRNKHKDHAPGYASHHDAASIAESRDDNSTTRTTTPAERELERDNAVAQVMNFLGDAPEYQDHGPEGSSIPSTNITPVPPVFHPPLFPPSSIPSPADEKSRLRIAEDQLLPSAPPTIASTQMSFAEPSAPRLSPFDEEDLYARPESSSLAAAAPAYERRQLSRSPPSDLNGDKAEIERQRLHAEASAPPIAGSSSSALAPSAPDITEEEEHGPGGLPRYTR